MAMEWPDNLENEHIAIIGRTGSGKTYAAKGLVERLLEKQRRVCIIDPTGAWWGLRSSESGDAPGYPIRIFGGDHADLPINKHAGTILAEVVATGNVPCVIDLSELLIGERHVFMEAFFTDLYRLNRGALYLIVDEADEFAPQKPLPETRRMLHHFDRIVRRGRIRGFRVSMLTQRPAVLHKDVLTQAATLVAMQLTAPQDRNAVMGWIKGQADEDSGKSLLDSLPRLSKGEGWIWAPLHDTLSRGVFPRIHTYDSSRSPDEEEITVPTFAEVDLESISARFEEAEKHAKANDPKLLRKRIAELEKEVARAKNVSGVDPKEVTQRVIQARSQGYEEAVQAFRSSVGSTIDHIHAAVTREYNLWLSAILPNVEEEFADEVIPVPTIRTVSVKLNPTRTPVEPLDKESGDADITGPQQRILDALDWFEQAGNVQPSKVVVAYMAGYTAGTGTVNNLYGQLRTAGLVDYPSKKCVSLTPLGRRSVTPRSSVIATNEELHQHVYSRLSAPLETILRIVIGRYPDSINKRELAVLSGYTPGTGTFSNYIGKLRSMKLVEYPQPKVVCASEELFIS